MSECPIVDEDGTEHRTCNADDLFRLLADSRRREIVSALEADENNRVDVDSLIRSELTTGDETDTTVLERELYHIHLPMLEDVGLIDYDGHSETIRCYRCDALSSVLDAVSVERS